MIQPHGLRSGEATGVAYSPLRRLWRLTGDASVNYLLPATKPA